LVPSDSSGTQSLRPHEQSQLALNRAKFGGELARFAERWLPWVSGCTTNIDPGGPKLNDTATARVACGYGAATVYFVDYPSVAARDKARTRYLAQHIDAQQPTPGVATPTQTATPSGASTGSYLEFAYTITSGERTGQVVAGLWWDNTATPVAGYLLAYWSDGLGNSWPPLRDVWQRTS